MRAVLRVIGTEGSRSPADNSPGGEWVGVSARVPALVFNTSDLKPSQLPTSVMDLGNPKWAGKLALGPGETDFQPIITSIADTYGTAAAVTWLKAVKANAGSHVYPDNETITAEVNSGQVEIGLINHYYWFLAFITSAAGQRIIRGGRPWRR